MLKPKYISQFSQKELELSSQKICMFDHLHQLCIRPLIDIQNIYSNFIFIFILNDLLRKNSFPWSLFKKIMSFYHKILGFSINNEIYSQLNVLEFSRFSLEFDVYLRIRDLWIQVLSKTVERI